MQGCAVGRQVSETIRGRTQAGLAMTGGRRSSARQTEPAQAKRLRGPALLALAALSLTPSPLLAQGDTESWEARLTQSQGSVTVYTAEEAQGVPGEKEMPLEAGDRVSTGEDGSAELALDGLHLIVLQSNSDFTLTDTRRTKTEFKLNLGNILAKIQSLLADQNVRVRTPTAVASVRGTEFGVEIPPDAPDETHIGVFDEGKVEVEGGAGPPEILKANQETRVLRGASPVPAYQLTRFAPQRRFMKGLGKRAQKVRKAWRALPEGARRQKRREAIERLRERRDKRHEDRDRLEQRQKRIEEPRDRREPGQKRIEEPRDSRRQKPPDRRDRLRQEEPPDQKKKKEKFSEDIRRRR